MSRPTSFTKANRFRKFNGCALALGFLIVFAVMVHGQQTAYTQNTADQMLRSTGRVNPSTLGMEMQIPLGGYKGRGVSVPINLSYSSKLWRLAPYGGYWVTSPGYFRSYNRAIYAEDSAAGWTVSTAAPYIEYTGEADFYDSFGNHIAINCPGCPPPENTSTSYIRRLTFHASDGGSHELRADDAPHAIDRANIVYDWNGTFYAVDGSKLRYIETANSCLLWMPDGSYYTFGAREQGAYLRDPFRRATSYTDSNGNSIYYNLPNTNYPNGSVSDTLGRTIPNITPPEKPSAPTTQSITLPGMTQPYKFYWKKLKDTTAAESALTDFTQTISYAGAVICQGPTSPGVSPFLFGITSESWTCATSNQDYFNPVLLTQIELPNGQSYRFSYNIYGEIDRVYYPTGGEEHFEYGQVPTLSDTYLPFSVTNRGVTKRQVYENAAATPTEWTFQADNGYSTTPISPYKITVTNPDGTKNQRFLRRVPQAGDSDDYGYSTSLSGMAFEERSLNAAGQVIGRKITNWQETILPSEPYSTHNAYRHPRVASEVNFVYEPGESYGLTSSVAYEYDGDINALDCPLNVKRVSVREFETTAATPPSVAENQQILPSTATPVKISETDYLIDVNYAAVNLKSLPVETRLKDSAGNVKAKSQLFYDEAGYGSGGVRGQVTRTRSWSDITNNLYIDTRAKYDYYGNLTEATDARGNTSITTYDSTYHTFPIMVTTPVPDPTGVNGSSTAFTTSTVFDTTTGLPTSSTDANGQTSTIEYNDPLLRPTKVTAPNGQQTITEYGAGTSASTRYVKVSSQLDATNWKQGYQWFDGLGRTVRTQSVDPAGDVYALTCYDNMGRVSKSSNPFRNWTTQDCATTTGMEWTSNTFDTAGRPWKVTTPDNAYVETTYGLATSGNAIGTTVTVADQAGKLRRSVTNALGQLARVDEPNSSNALGSVSSPNQDTSYAYDLLNNLTTVTQGSQTRIFEYDALSRLKSAANPESGSIAYTYDNNGNLATKTDARSISTTYTYDALNRVTFRDYSDSTPDTTYTYDNKTYAKGKLTKVSNANSTTEYTSFDILGRVTGHKQTTSGTNYTTSYTYSLSGQLTQEIYPSGRGVSAAYASNGDMSNVYWMTPGRSGGFNLWNRARNFTYNAAGAITSMQLGSGRWESTTFNSRLQPTQIALGTTQNGYDLLKLNYTYNTSGNADNNGNLLTQTITVPTVGANNGFTAVQSYTYDSLNRIKDAIENVTPNGGSASQSWKQTFTYDRYGNRNFDAANTTTLGSCPAAQCNPTINALDNRFTSGQGYSYDSSGNTTADALGRSFVYDGENKQTSVSNSGGNIGTYLYDGDGKRVKKTTSTGDNIIFVYDAAGKLIEEYPVSTPTTVSTSYVYAGARMLSTETASGGSAVTTYMTADHLGSPRINTDYFGNVTARHDYHPFGEEIYTSQRTTGVGYTADGVRKQFTGYERDGETGLDFAEARMYGSFVGRFGVPDFENISADQQIPQSWNGYIYVLNNPLVFTDPSGLIWLRQMGTDDYQWVDDDVYNANLKKDKDYYKGYIASNYEIITVKSGTGKYAQYGGQRVMLGADGSVNPVSDNDLERGTVHFGTDDPLQQVFGGHEDVMQYWRTPIYAIGTAEMAALSLATAAGVGAGGSGLTTLNLGTNATNPALEMAVGRALLNPNIMNHIFSAKHMTNFGPLLLRFGSKAALVQAVIRALGDQKLQEGVQRATVMVGDKLVTVSVYVENGVIKVNNFWVP